MFKLIASPLAPILENPYVKRIRRNHGLEHATIHLLNRQNYTLSGRASAGGFVVMGEVPTEKLETAAHEALRLMKQGQSQLAIHPHCGTNLVTTGFLATLVGALGFINTNRRSVWSRFPLVMMIVLITVLYSHPIGMGVQEHITTDGNPGDLEIIAVKRSQISIPTRKHPLVMHHILTR